LHNFDSVLIEETDARDRHAARAALLEGLLDEACNHIEHSISRRLANDIRERAAVPQGGE
jgi:hypothetical protein